MILLKQSINKASLTHFSLVAITVVIACLLYKLLEFQSLKHSAALFLGIPIFMSIGLAASYNQKHITINVIFGLSLGLLASFIYLDEGSFCVQ